MAATPVALRAASFIDGIGVNTHINWQDAASAYKDQAKVRAALEYLGADYVRDATPFAGWTQPFYETLAADGIKFNIPVSSTEYNRTGSFLADLARIDAFARAKPGSVVSIEGLNEVNTWPVNYGGSDTSKDLALGRGVQAQLYREADGFAALKDIPVLNLTVGGISVQQASVMGDMSAISDYGAWHVYFGGGDQPGVNIRAGAAAAKLLNPSDPVQITETNYYTAVHSMEWDGGGVTESVQAKFDLNLLMDAAKAGVTRTYFYELLDNGYTPTTTIEGSLGLFHHDGTPKPAATAIHNLTAILADEAAGAFSFATGALDFSVAGLPSTGQTLLLQKADGRYDLVVWAEPDIWDASTHTAITAPGSQVTVTLGQAAGTISVYDPLTGTAPIATAKNTNVVSVTVTDHPLILEIAGLGATAPPLPPPPPPPAGPAVVSVGSGPDTLVLKVSQDAYQGAARYTVSVDGVRIGGTFTASASHAAGQSDTVTLKGDWTPGAHAVAVDFLNDAYGGTAATDRNLYVDGATYNGRAVPGAAKSLLSSGAQGFSFTEAAPPPPPPGSSTTVGSGSDTLVLRVSQDAYLGDAQYTVSVDGKQVGGTLTAKAPRGGGQADTVTVKGEWVAGGHTVTVNFLNDRYDAPWDAAHDRNLYVEGATYNGQAVGGAARAIYGGSQSFAVKDASSAAVTVGSGTDSIALKISQDAYKGDAQYVVLVDGAQIGGVQTARGLRSLGQYDPVTVKGSWAAGDHKVTVKFLNDAWGGTPDTDRNLYVEGVTYDGRAVAGGTASLYGAGGADFTVNDTTAPSVNWIV